jgi:hypothetical protein
MARCPRKPSTPLNSPLKPKTASETYAMHPMITLGLLALFIVAPSSIASAQLLTAKDAAIVYGHHHLSTTSIDEHKKFWVETLGGTAIKAGNFDVIKFPNVLIFLTARASSGPT